MEMVNCGLLLVILILVIVCYVRKNETFEGPHHEPWDGWQGSDDGEQDEHEEEEEAEEGDADNGSELDERAPAAGDTLDDEHTSTRIGDRESEKAEEDAPNTAEDPEEKEERQIRWQYAKE